MKTIVFNFLLGCCLLYAAFGNGAQRPNILFVFADDQRYDALSVVQQEQGEKGRYPWLKTPNMDKLAAEGVRFRNAFVVNSLCSPSRAVNLTGLYNHLNGIASNFRDFPVDNVTHASLLRAAGYATAYIGKWHMNSQVERPGFDYAASYIGHARYYDPDFIVQGKKIPKKGWIDDISTDYAVNYIKSRKESEQPWFMVVGFKTPHGPFEPPPRTKNIYLNAKAKVVPNFNAPAPYLNEKFKESVASRQLEEKVSTNLGYFRCITAADECLGRMLDALDENGFRDNTLVIYTSDNGFYLGEHGIGDKRSAYEESLRVPFIVRYPPLGGVARGRTCDRMVLNLDLVRSLLDFAGVQSPENIQGRSWKPLLSGDVADWRKSWFYEYFAEAQRNCRIPDITGVRTENSKLVFYRGHPEYTEMFDLKSDPYEIKNLYNNPEFAEMRAELEREHARLYKDVGYVVPDFTDRPFWWDLPGGADWKPDSTPQLKLTFKPENLRGQMVVDVGDTNAKPVVKGSVKTVNSTCGTKAFQFDGKSYIEVGKPDAVNPAMNSFSIEVVAEVKPESNGALVAMGGQSMGYCLSVINGIPQFAVNSGKNIVVVKTKKPQRGWVKLTAMLSADLNVELMVDGRSVGRKKISGFFNRMPNDGMQIGADSGSPVLKQPAAHFSGLIESVNYYTGEKR